MNPVYMLDTDTVSHAFRNVGGVAERIRSESPSGLCISGLTLAELRYGASVKRSKRIHRLIDAFVSQIAVVAFDEAAAVRYGDIAAILAEGGATIGQMGTLIAAHALAIDSVLVTNNVRHFGRVKQLRVETWV